MKKYLGLFLLLFLTGCSVNYHVTINDNLSITENAIIYGTESLYDEYYKTTKLNVLKDLLANYEDILKEKKYEYSIVSNPSLCIKISKTYESISEYINSSLLFNDYFDKINYVDNYNKVKIYTEGFNPNNPEDPGRFDIEELSILIKSAYKVTNHNAKMYDKKTNTYKYKLSNTTKDFSIVLEIDTNSKFNKYYNEILIIMSCLLIIIIIWIYVVIQKKKKR